MKVNGFQIQNQIKLARMASETAYTAFTKNILQFESEKDRPSLTALHERFTAAEDRVARLSTLQDFFNTQTKVTVLGKQMSLAEVLNRVNGLGRAAKLWRLAANASIEVPRYSRAGSPDVIRDKEKEYAVRAMSQDEAMKRVYSAEEIAAAYREALATGNANTIEMDSEDETLFRKG